MHYEWKSLKMTLWFALVDPPNLGDVTINVLAPYAEHLEKKAANSSNCGSDSFLFVFAIFRYPFKYSPTKSHHQDYYMFSREFL